MVGEMTEDTIPDWLTVGARVHADYGPGNHSNWSGLVVVLALEEPTPMIGLKRWQRKRKRWHYFWEPAWFARWVPKGNEGPILRAGPLPKGRSPRILKKAAATFRG